MIPALLMFAFVLLSCEENEPVMTKNYDYVKYGTSFNMCAGYCYNQLEISDSKIEFKKKGWLASSIPEILIKEGIHIDYWEKLIAKINFDSFTALDTIIGCPDCADGGAEWVEIQKGGVKHRVVFEYGDEPLNTRPFIEYLRAYMCAFQIEDDKKVNFNERVLIEKSGVLTNPNLNGGYNKVLLELGMETGKVQYHAVNFDTAKVVWGGGMTFHGVLTYDSTEVCRALPPQNNPCMKVRNIKLFDLNFLED